MDAASLVKRIEDEATEKSKEKARRDHLDGHSADRLGARLRDHRVGGGSAVRRDEGQDHRSRGPQHPGLRAGHGSRPYRGRHSGGGDPLVLRSGSPGDRPDGSVNLIADGRIHPARIEEIVEKVKAEMDEKLLADGEAGRLGARDCRPSSGASEAGGAAAVPVLVRPERPAALEEVAWLAAHMAAELGADAASRSGRACSTTSARRSTGRWTAPTSSSVASCCASTARRTR